MSITEKATLRVKGNELVVKVPRLGVEHAIPIHPRETRLPADYELRSDHNSRAAGAALGVVIALAVIMAVLFTVAILTGCGSALADQCEALYAGADTPEKLAAADAACSPDGGAR